MRVALFQQNAAMGATEYDAARLAQGLDARGHEVHLFLPLAPVLAPLREAVPPSVVIHAFRDDGVRSIPRLARQIRALAPDILHANDPALLGLAAARLARVPRVLTFHTPGWKATFSWVGQRVYEFAMSGAHVIAVSDRNRRRLEVEHQVPKEKLHVIPYGLPPEGFEPHPDAGSVRAELGIGPSTRLVVCAARLSPQKRHDVLLRAIGSLRKEERESLVVALLGDGELRPAIESMVRSEGLDRVVRLLGHRQDVRRFLSAADVSVLSSDYEGMPFALLESMAQGLPVVATDVDGTGDLIEHGVTGYLVPARDPVAFGAALGAAVIDPGRIAGLGRAARRHCLAYHTTARSVDLTIECYQRILQGVP